MKVAPPGFTWCGVKGDLDVYLTHVQFPEDHDEHGALYLRNEHRHNEQGGCPVYLVTLRELWEFRPEDRDRGPHHSYDAMQGYLGQASMQLYGEDNKANRQRIHDALMEYADDVKNLKPPAHMSSAQWREQLKRHGVQLKVEGQQVL